MAVMTSTVGASPGAREPLRHREFRWLLAARFTGFIGGAVAPVALAFAVLDLTGSVRDLGLVVGGRSLANVLLLLVGGVLADRLPLAVLLRGSAVAAALTQAAVAALVLSGTANLTSLAALSALGGAVSALLLPGTGALTPRTVPASLLQPANALLRLTRSAAVVGGSALAGILVAAVGPGWGIAVDAASFAAAAVCFGRIRIVPAPLEDAAADGAAPAGARSWPTCARAGPSSSRAPGCGWSSCSRSC
jgi:MFS family permease